MYLKSYDSTLTQVSSDRVHSQGGSSRGLASSSRGDIFSINHNVVYVIEREYSNLDNPLLPTAIPHPAVVNVDQRAGVPVLDVDYIVTDADSPTPTGHDEEGWFFTWTPEELAEVLGADELSLVRAHWGVKPGGNFEGRTILNVVQPLGEVAAGMELAEADG